jgi:hypothetical protein
VPVVPCARRATRRRDRTLEAEHLAAEADLRAEPPRVREQRGRGEHRLDLRVVGVVRTEVEVVREVRLELAQAGPVEQLRARRRRRGGG